MRDYASKEALLNKDSSLYRKPRVNTGPPRGRRFLRVGLKVAGYGFFLGTAFTLGYWGLQTLEALPYLMVKEVILEGGKHVNAAELSNLAGISPRQNLLTLDLREARYKVLQNPWVEEATIRRRFPQTIIMSVKEREPAAIMEVAPADKRFLVGADGMILEEVSMGGSYNLPLITGLNPAEVKPGKVLPYENISQSLMLVGKLNAHQPEQLGRIKEVRLRPDGSLQLSPTYLAAPLYIKAENFAEQWPIFLQFLEERRKGAGGRSLIYEYIDLRFAGKIVTKPYQGRTSF